MLIIRNIINKQQIGKIFTHPLFLAVPFAVLIILLLPPLFQKYKGSIETSTVSDLSSKASIIYADLDMDGYSEKIGVSIWNNNSTSVVLYTHDGAIINQFNFMGFFHYDFDLLHGDADNNGKEEIYFHTYTEDSIVYLNTIELLGDTQYVSKQKIVTIVNFHDKKLDFFIRNIGLADLDKDSIKELVFYINSGYSLQPRNVYAYNRQKDTIISSPKSYGRITNVEMNDLDSDGIMEIINQTHACANTKANIDCPYHDHSAWLMVLDNNLKFKYKPIEYKGDGNVIQAFPVEDQGKNYLIALIKNMLSGKEFAKLILFDNKLNVIRERLLEKELARFYSLSKIRIKEKVEIYLFDHKSLEVQVLGFDLQEKSAYPFKANASSYYLDIDNDYTDEYIGFDKSENKMIVQRSDFTNPVEYDIPESLGPNYLIFSVRQNGKNAPQCCVQRGNRTYLLNYEKNDFYFLKYPFYISLYGFFALFFYLIMKVQKKRIEQKYAIERELVTLQIRTIKNQADPHFIFNALNTISSLIYKEDKDTAYNILNDFSSLIRAAIVNSDKMSISLSEELDFVGNYLKLEKIRFKTKFEYSISIDDNINKTIQVPRMIIHTYTENAIKHGIMHASYPCKLLVEVKQNHKNLLILIDDDGIGRLKSKEYAKHSTGVGLQIMDRVFELYFKIYGIKVKQMVEDKLDIEGKSNGTRIIIEIPLRNDQKEIKH